MKESIEIILRREIEFMFGRRIVSSRDCMQLCEEIFRVTKARLNQNTLRRFFGLVKTSYSPSGSTLQILCKYCGFNSIEDAGNQDRAIQNDAQSPEKRILLNFLVGLYRDTPVERQRDTTFGSIVKQTILFLNQYPELLDKFQSAIAKTKNGQDYYFGTYVQIDKLNSCFGNGLRYYLNEKTDAEGQITGHSLLVLKSWLTENQPDIERHYQVLKSNDAPLSFTSYTSGRYFASLVYHADAMGYSNTEMLSTIQNYYDSLQNADTKELVAFELIIAEALILTNNMEEGMYYSDLALKKLHIVEKSDESVIQNIYLLHCVALYKTGSFKEAELMYPYIRPTYFDFLKKKLLTILYGYLTEQWKKNIISVENQHIVLIEETGFTRLYKFLNKDKSFINVDIIVN